MKTIFNTILNTLQNVVIANFNRKANNRESLRKERLAQMASGERASLSFVLRCAASRF